MLILIAMLLFSPLCSFAQETVVVRPSEIDDVLVNPGIGFMTFQRFNGDHLNSGLKWTEGYPIVYEPFTGSLENRNHPMTSLAYFRIYWKFIEPEMQEYNWDLIDTALKTARAHGQTLLLRIAPYGTETDNDVPDWYRRLVGDEEGKLPVRKWRTDPENPGYVQYFGGMIRQQLTGEKDVKTFLRHGGPPAAHVSLRVPTVPRAAKALSSTRAKSAPLLPTASYSQWYRPPDCGH